MSTTITIPDKTFKYAFCYGHLSALMIELEIELGSAKAYKRPIDMERIATLLNRYKAVDDALNASFND